jgi:hypothetical protein
VTLKTKGQIVNLSELKKDLAYKWRPQECKEYGANMVAYIDSRDVQDLLDEVCGADKWQDRYKEVKGHVYCEIGIKCGEDWVWKGDCGTESNVEKEKGESSDAFKRAAVKWGIGRFLYSLGTVKLKAKKHSNNKYYPAHNGKIIWDKAELSNICNKLIGKKPEDELPPALKKNAPVKDKPSVEKKFNKLKKMTDQETACMSEIMLKTQTLHPKDLSKRDFKLQRAIDIFAKYGRWPGGDDEVTLCIEFINDMYGRSKK